MNFYQMDLEDYRRFIISNDVKDDLTLALYEDLTEINRIYSHFVEVIEEFDLCTYNPEFLRMELQAQKTLIEDLEKENKSLQEKLNVI